MNIVPARIEEQVSRVDRTYSLVIGIFAALTALWSLYRVFWLVYTAATYSSLGWSPVSLVVPLVLWLVIGLAAGFVPPSCCATTTLTTGNGEFLAGRVSNELSLGSGVSDGESKTVNRRR